MNDFNLNFYNLVIAAGIIHGILFSSIIFFKKQYSKATYIYLGLTVLALSLSNLQYWFYDTKINIKYPFVSYFYVQFELLIVPFFYFFVLSYLQKRLKIKVIIISLFAFLASSILQITLYTFPSPNLSQFTNIFIELTSISFNVILIILIFYTIIKYEKKTSISLSEEPRVNISWLKKILIIGILLCALWAFGFNQSSGSVSDLSKYYPLWIGISILVYTIAYLGVFHSNIFLKELEIKSERVIFVKQKKILPSKKRNEVLFLKFLQIIEDSETYKNPDLKLNDIALELEISSNYLSQLINNHSKENFKTIINKKRIELAKNIIVSDEFNTYTVQSIAYETGFNSKSSFYNTFKKMTGHTPVSYRKEKL